ncbi:MAG: universal stress protein [Beijerinckiaceae bacterium]
MYKTILAPVDLGEPEAANDALDTAVALAKSSGGALRLINVQQMLPATYMDYMPTDFDDKQREWAEQEIRAIAAKLDFPQERLSTHIRFGGAYPEILAEAEEWGADLVVIGSHRPAMSTYLLGSTATSVVRHAKCSVLVVRK